MLTKLPVSTSMLVMILVPTVPKSAEQVTAIRRLLWSTIFQAETSEALAAISFNIYLRAMK